MRANSQDLRANSQDMRANSQDMRANSQDTRANSQGTRANSQDLRASSQDTRSNSQDMRANSQDMRANSNDLMGQNQDLTDDSQLMAKANRVYNHIILTTNQILASPNKSMVMAVMPHPLHDLPTHISRASMSVTPELDKGHLNPQVWGLQFRDRPRPVTVKKGGGDKKPILHSRTLAYSILPEPTKRTKGPGAISTVILLHSKVIALRRATRGKAVMMWHPCIVAHMRCLPVHMATA